MVDDDEQWLRRLLEASQSVLERVRTSGKADRQLVPGLEALILDLEQQLDDRGRETQS